MTHGRAVVLGLSVTLAAWLSVFPYSAALNNPNERTRVLQARSVLDRRTLSIGNAVRVGRALRYEDPYGKVTNQPFVNDIAVTCQNPAEQAPCAGALYPAKAPGTALLGLPFLALAKGFGAIPEGPSGETRATWVLRLSVSAFVIAGLAALAALLRRAGVRPQIVLGTVLAAGLGSSLFPYGVSFVGHAAAGASLLLSAWMLAWALDSKPSKPRHTTTTLAGLLAGAAVLFEYHAVPAAMALGAWTLISPHRLRLAPGFAIGGGVAVLAFTQLHLAMYGNAFETGHGLLVSAHNRESQAHGFLGLDGFHLDSLGAHLGDVYMGLGPTMPWLLLLGLPGLFWLFRGRLGKLPDGAARSLAASVVVYLLFVTCLGNYRVMNGWSIGPRYLVPAMLPLAFAAGVFWEKLASLSRVASAVAGALVVHAIVVIVVITVAYPSPPNDVVNPFGELALPLLGSGYGVRSIGLGIGRAWFVPTALVATAALSLVGYASTEGARRALKAAGVVVVGVGLAMSLAFYRPTKKQNVEGARTFMADTVEGASPKGNGKFFK